MIATEVSNSSRTPPSANTQAARTRTRVRARASSCPVAGVRPPETSAIETPASVANRIDERPSTTARQVPGSQPSSPVAPRWAPNMPRTANPRARSTPPIRRPGAGSRAGTADAQTSSTSPRCAIAGSPAAGGVPLALRQRGDVDAHHRLPEAAGDLGDHGGVVGEGGRLHDGRGPLRRVAGLEAARADEDALGAQLHHHRRVRRGGDAARGE